MSEIRTSQPVVPGASYVIMEGTSFSGSRTQKHIQYVNYILVPVLPETVSQDQGNPRNRFPGTYSIQELDHGK